MSAFGRRTGEGGDAHFVLACVCVLNVTKHSFARSLTHAAVGAHMRRTKLAPHTQLTQNTHACMRIATHRAHYNYTLYKLFSSASSECRHANTRTKHAHASISHILPHRRSVGRGGTVFRADTKLSRAHSHKLIHLRKINTGNTHASSCVNMFPLSLCALVRVCCGSVQRTRKTRTLASVLVS